MDRTFLPSAWHPTAPCRSSAPENLEALITELNVQSEKLYTRPYDPVSWLGQAATLAKLHYPELCAGAAWKAQKLCRKLLSKGWSEKAMVLTQGQEGEWRLGAACGFWMTDDGENTDREREALLRERLERCLGRASQLMDAQLRHNTPLGAEGLYLPQMYPWMDTRFRERGDQLLDHINRELADSVPRAAESRERPFVDVRRHAFGEKEGSRNTLGIFALRDIEAGTVCVVDRSITWGCPGGKVISYDEMGNGASGCMSESHAEAMLQCRFLLAVLEDGVQHPLDHHLIARLTPTYPTARTTLSRDAEVFDVETDIAIPNTLLARHGVDIFANRAWDTWVLMTLAARSLNNNWADSLHMYVHPLFSLFNHSCEPNVVWQTEQEDPTPMLIRVSKDVKQEEQLFVEYDGFQALNGLNTRRKRLRKWLDTDCLCTRCLREESELKDWTGGGIGDEDEDEHRKAWDDIGPKVIFPEDIVC